MTSERDATAKPPARYASVDSLRGITVAAMLVVNDPGDWAHIYAPLEHSAWNGFTPTDLIFPLFLFIVGVSISLAVNTSISSTISSTMNARAVLLRAVRIVLLGLALNLIAHWALATPTFRPMGVLQRIGVCYAVAALLAIHASARAQWAIGLAILAGYFALLCGAPLTKEANLVSHVDAWLLGPHAYEFDAASGLGHDPEGVLSTLPAIVTTLLGVRCGAWLRRGDVAGLARTLAFAASIALVAGGLLSVWQPINKNLWTPAFVLWSGGWSIAALLAAHLLVDRHGWPALARSLGVNAIAAYALGWLLVCLLEGTRWGAALYQASFARIAPWAGPYAASFAWALAFTAVCWVAMALLARRGVRIKI